MILAPFQLLQLPKFARNSKVSVPVFSGYENLFVGVSSSSINKLSLRPPQVLSAHAVPPGTTITAILATEDCVVAYASVDRGKFYLNLLKSEDAAESSGSKPRTVIETPEEISNLYLSSDKSQIAALGSDTSRITGYSADDLSELWTEKRNDVNELIFSSLVTDSSSLDGASTTNFVVLSRTTRKTALLTTYALDNKTAHKLLTVEIDGPQADTEVLADSHFSQNKDLLYQAVGTHIYIYRIPDGVLLNSFEIARLQAIDGIVALPNNNIAIVKGTNIDLIDCTFQSHIYSFTLQGKGPLELLAFSESASVIVVMQNQSALLGLPVTPTKGRLLESVGKGSAHKHEDFAFADIFAGFTANANSNDSSNASSSQDYKAVASNQLSQAKKETEAVISGLEDAIARRDGPTFAEVITYLKDPSLEWTEWHASGTPQGPQEQDLVYEETDRNADRRLIRRICELAFLPRFKPFLPIGVAVYLLTHPLFPTGEPKFNDLLKSLEKSDVILFRQALVSLPGITAKDLVLGLLTHDDATFLDAAVRLQEDYGSQQVLQGIRETFGRMHSISSLSILIERLSRFPDSVGLVSPFIDAMGLLAWDLDHIKRLKSNLSNQVEAIQSYFRADAAVTELFNAIGMDVSESAVPSSAAELRNIREARRVNSNEDEDHHIPNYSVEALML